MSTSDLQRPYPRRSDRIQREPSFVKAFVSVLATAALICFALLMPVLWIVLGKSTQPLAPICGQGIDAAGDRDCAPVPGSPQVRRVP